MFQAPRGTQDTLPGEQPYWHFVRKKAEEIASLYGYRRIDTPTFEDSGLFTRTVGAGTDIVEKEMYTFTDLGGGQVPLRPEGTAPVCRAYIEHGMANLPQPVKMYYLSSIFRYERPQAGRLREHHQFGFEAIGEAGASLDAEVIDMAWRLYASLGLKDFKLKINSIGCPECRPVYIGALRKYFEALPLCSDCTVRIQKNTLRLLDCKNPSCQAQAQEAPQSVDYLCTGCAEHFRDLKRYLEMLGLPFEMDPGMVRGLDYYTRTVFEIQPLEEGGQSTIGGGGRYDGLIEEIGGKPTPGVGFATGMERIILHLKRQGVKVPDLPGPRVFIAWAGEKARQEAMALSQRLRTEGIGNITPFSPRSLKAQLRAANSQGCAYTVIIGDEELAKSGVTLRNMETASQEEVPADALVAKLKLEKL